MQESVTHTSLLDGLNDRGNQHAWARFMQRYHEMLLAFAKRIGLSDDDARELTADTIATCVEKYPDGAFDRQKGRLRDWLRGVLMNHVRRQRERRAVARGHAENVARTLTAQHEQRMLVEAYQTEWRLERLNRALERLRLEADVDTYQAFDLLARGGWPAREIAGMLNMTPNSIYVAKHRMLSRLREIVRELAHGDEM